MSLDDFPELKSVMMVDGAVFGKIAGDSRHTTMELGLADARIPFVPCPEGPQNGRGPLHRLDANHLPLRCHATPLEDAPGDIFACWVNHLADWALPGTDTVQIMINRADAPCTLHFNDVITVQTAATDLHFDALLAAHRAAADLRIIFRDTSSDTIQSVDIPFDPACTGGTTRPGYQKVSVPVPENLSTFSVSLEFLFHGKPELTDENPFLFVADAKVLRPPQTDAQASLTRPNWFVPDDHPETGTWLRAPLPYDLAPEQPITLRRGDRVTTLGATPAPALTVRENYGHTLICQAPEPAQILLSIDGTPVEEIAAQTGDTIIRIPNRYLTGHVRKITLRDLSGCCTVFEQQQLLPHILTPEDVMRRESKAPFPPALLPQSPHRYAALKAILANAPRKSDLPMMHQALLTLEGGHENVKLHPLHFPKVQNPDVSIIIPAHNKVEVTFLALCALRLAHNNATFEVILVDDASTDDTAQIENWVTGLQIIRHITPQRFIRACNAGATKARGTYIALLNNDTEVTLGWLDALIDALHRFNNAGLVGSKLLYPNGTLQEAGGIVWSSGNPWNYGKGENPHDPRFCYARQVDYLSGAALLLPRALWDQVGGLSSELEPMYFEDTDLAFKIRAAGHTTWYVPSSVVYHFEGLTSGTDPKAGYKKHQELNRPKFKRRWASAFAQNGTEGQSPDLEKDRNITGRVLFIDHAPPRPDKDAGSYAAIQEMKLVQSLGFKVTFLSTNMAHLGTYTDALQRDGVEVIHAPFFMNPADYIEKHGRTFDAIYITRYYVARAVLDLLRHHAPQAKILFNNADLHFLRELRAARSNNDSGQMDRARQTRTAEMEVIDQVDVVLSYNDVEHSVIQAYSEGQATVVKCPWVADMPEDVPGLKGRQGLSFLGSFQHHPNTEGIQWFGRQILPAIKGEPTPHLTIYGSGITDDIRALASDTITPVGFVPDIADAFHPHRIFVAPLLSGAGIKGKVIAALSHGIPCILSPVAAEGIGLRSGHDCLIAISADDWASAITALTTDDALWQNLSQNARSYMKDRFSFTAGREAMRAAFEAADIYAARP